MVNYVSDPTGDKRIFLNNPAWGSGEDSNGNVQQVNSAIEAYRKAFSSLLGRDPTQDEVSGFAQNALYGAWNQPGDLSYSDTQGLSNQYINDQFGQQIADRQLQQQTDAQNKQLDSTQSRVADLVKSLNQKTSDYLTSPEAQAQIQGKLNNSGMLNSGAYSQTLAGLMAQGANQNEASALQGVTIPALNNIQGLSSMSGLPYQQSLASGSGAMNHLNSIGDFNMQASLAQMLANQGGQSTAQSILGMGSSAAQGGGSLMQGAGAMKGTSYVCKELINRGLLCEWDMEDFHIHIMPAMLKKGRAFWKYAMHGFQLVEAANKAGVDWAQYKPLLFDRVMKEKDPCKAVDLYAEACYLLCGASDSLLWDERVFRTSFWDSLQFLPRLFLYQPFREALAKCLRIKTMFLYDKPTCQVHR